jgi:SHS family sialic acid transporter-like MFS transporter
MTWLKDINRTQWQTLFAAHLGWLLDGFDVMLYAFALLQIKDEFDLHSAESGAVAAGGFLGGSFGDEKHRSWFRISS